VFIEHPERLPAADPEGFADFTAASVTRQFAGVLDTVVARAGERSGHARWREVCRP
jgi:hypothetical protein